MIFEQGMLALLLIFLVFFTVRHNVQWLPLSLLTSYTHRSYGNGSAVILVYCCSQVIPSNARGCARRPIHVLMHMVHSMNEFHTHFFYSHYMAS